jgi:hypothetical protein
MTYSPPPGSQAAAALQISERMQELVGAGEWDEVESLAIELRRAVMAVAETDRRPLLLALQRSTTALAADAKAAREDVGGKISELRRGQAAKKAYELS